MDIVLEAKDRIAKIDKQFRKMNKSGTLDELRFGEYLDEILKKLETSAKVDNNLLIELEKFYQHCSFLIGLSSLKIDDGTKQAWRQYDQFHFEQVKPKLSLYGPIALL